MNTLTTFATWAELLNFIGNGRAHLFAGQRLLYQAPMSVRPCTVRIVRIFKNGKLRLDPGYVNGDKFTADSTHLDRFRKGEWSNV